MSDFYSLNRVILIGRLVEVPELQYTKGEKRRSFTRFTVATNEFFMDRSGAGNHKKASYYHNVTAWGQKAEMLTKFCYKGMILSIDGRLRHTTYTDQETDKHLKYYFVEAEQIVFLGKKPEHPDPEGGYEEEDPEDQNEPDQEEDPF